VPSDVFVCASALDFVSSTMQLHLGFEAAATTG